MNKLTVLVCFVLLLAGSISAQDVLTNDTVVALFRSGLSNQIIIAKIKAQEGKFDTSTAALLKLSEAKIPGEIVVAMIDRQSKQNTERTKAEVTFNEILASIPEQGGLADMEGKTDFYILTSIQRARERIAGELTKAGFKQVDRIEDSDFIIGYSEIEEFVSDRTAYKNKIGEFRVVVPVIRNGVLRPRDVFGRRNEKFYVFTEEPATAGAKEFIQALRKFRGK